jgi:hypothetical protein
MIGRNRSRADGSQCERSCSERQGELVFVQSQDAVAAVDFYNGHRHFGRQKQGHRAGKQAEDQKYSPEGLKNARDIHELSRQAVLHKHPLHRRRRTCELRIAVREKDHAKGYAQDQQAQRLKRTEKFHKHLESERNRRELRILAKAASMVGYRRAEGESGRI